MKFGRHWLIRLVACCALLPVSALASQCAATFADGLTNSTSAGSILFTNYARLINNPDTILATTSVTNNGFVYTCTSADCSASGTPVPPLTGDFYSTNSPSSDYSINGYSAVVNADDFGDLIVKNGGVLYFSSSYDTYRLDKLRVENYSRVYMTPGTYYIDSLEIKGNSELRVDGNGTVRIYARSMAKFRDDALVNGGSYGDASKLFLYYHASGGDDKIKVESGARVTAIMYSANKVEVKGTSDVYGAISAAGDIQIKNDSWVTYRESAIADTDFGNSCSSGPAPVDHFVIEHDGSGSTCEAETVTVKACLNADCSSLSTDTLSLNFNVDGQNQSSQTFTGSTTFNFNHTTAEAVTLSLSNTSVTPLHSTQCSDGSGSSCTMVFSSAGCSSGNTCATTFADAATNSTNSGSVVFEDWGRLINNPDTVLQTTSVVHNASIMYTCGSADCTASGSIVPTLSGSFESNTTDRELEVDGWSWTIPENDYDKIEVKNGGVLNMSSSYSKYRIGKLQIDYLAWVNMTAGDYYIDQLEVNDGARINVIGSGTVRLFIKSKAEFNNQALINGGLFGDASKLFIYYFGDSSSDEDEDEDHHHHHHDSGGGAFEVDSASTIAGFIYSKGDVELKNYGGVYGAVAAEGDISIEDASFISYRGDAIDDTDFGDACSASGNVVDHYRFEYGGSGLTCQAQSITVKACANADCSSLYQQPATITLQASTPKPSSTSTTFSFVGSTTLQLGETAPTTVTLSMPSASPSANLTCLENDQFDASCDYDTQDTGFIIVNETDGSQTIPSQISGKPSNVGYHAKVLTLKAVQTNTTNGVCTNLFADGSNVAIDFAYQCEDPGSCSANTLQVLNNGNTYNLTNDGNYSSHNILFDSDSKATIALNYPDAGKIKLKVKKDISLEPGKITTMYGNSNDFVVRPFGFFMNFSGNPAATDNTGGVFRRAGEKFDMTLSAVQWQNGEDNDNDGHPDPGADLSNNPVTPNFGLEALAESATITTGIVSPAGGHNPALVNNRFSAFSNGSQSKTGGNGLSWGDVGVVSFTAAGDGNYLDSGENITTSIPYVGRFVPSHFRLKSASLTQACGNFSYMGQVTQLSLNLEAQGVGDISLLNYDSGSGQHGLAGVSFVAENGNSGQDLGGRLSSMPTSWVDGEINTTFQPSFARLTASPWIDGPYDDLYIGLKVDDGEPTLQIPLKNALNGAADMNAGDNGDCIAGGNCDAMKLNTAAASFRYGRLNSEHAYGPVGNALKLPLFTQYWNGSTFALSESDNCSSLDADELNISSVAATPFAADYNVIHLTDGFVVGTTMVNQTLPGSGATSLNAQSGVFALQFTAPSLTTGNTGYVPVTVDLSAYPWLQFAWSNNGQGAGENTLPEKRATFGQFRGNDRVIYWRERH